jgi:hypothetical protein
MKKGFTLLSVAYFPDRLSRTSPSTISDAVGVVSRSLYFITSRHINPDVGHASVAPRGVFNGMLPEKRVNSLEKIVQLRTEFLHQSLKLRPRNYRVAHALETPRAFTAPRYNIVVR